MHSLHRLEPRKVVKSLFKGSYAANSLPKKSSLGKALPQRALARTTKPHLSELGGSPWKESLTTGLDSPQGVNADSGCVQAGPFLASPRRI
jgi:hypothetical protein